MTQALWIPHKVNVDAGWTVNDWATTVVYVRQTLTMYPAWLVSVWMALLTPTGMIQTARRTAFRHCCPSCPQLFLTFPLCSEFDLPNGRDYYVAIFNAE